MDRYISEKALAILAMTGICLAAIFGLESGAAKDVTLTALGAMAGYTIHGAKAGTEG